MNDQTIDAARELLAYYTATRRAGHTTVMLEGAMHHPCLIVSHNQKDGNYIKETIKLSPVALSRSNEVVSLPSIARGSLRGMNKPPAKSIIADGPQANGAQGLRWAQDGAKAKNLGQVETPEAVATVMASWLFPIHPEAILDPAVGPGALLRACSSAGRHPRLVGIDIDPESISIANHGVPAGTQLIQADYLLYKTEPYPAIIANPPYVKAVTYGYSGSDWETIQATLGMSLDCLTNVYALFILKIWHDLSEGGRAAVIVPAEFLNANYGEEVKEALLRRTKPAGLAVFNPSVSLFDNALTTSAIVFFDKKRRRTHPVWASIVNNLTELSSFIQYLDKGTEHVTPHAVVDVSGWNPKDKWINPLLRASEPLEGRRQQRSFKRNLRDYYHCKRGIATGANDYFCLALDEIKERGLSLRDFSRCITKSSDAPTVFFTEADFQSLIDTGRRCYLLDPATNNDALRRYLAKGEEQKIHERYLTKTRGTWYKPEARGAANIWVGVFSRERVGYILNEAGIKNLTCFHGLYRLNEADDVDLPTLLFLNSSFGAESFAAVSRFYGSGLNKVEPKDVEAMPCPVFPVLSKAETAELKIEMTTRAIEAGKAGKTPEFTDLCQHALGL